MAIRAIHWFVSLVQRRPLLSCEISRLPRNKVSIAAHSWPTVWRPPMKAERHVPLISTSVIVIAANRYMLLCSAQPTLAGQLEWPARFALASLLAGQHWPLGKTIDYIRLFASLRTSCKLQHCRGRHLARLLQVPSKTSQPAAWFSERGRESPADR